MAGVFDPIQIGNVEVKNRIAYPPMLSCLCGPGGYATKVMADYYAERAKGGAGLITVEVHFITPRSRVSRPLEGDVPLIDDDSHIQPLKKVVEGVKAYGTPIFAQMAHMGKFGLSGGIAQVPSAVNPPFADAIMGTRRKLKEMTQEDIDWVLEQYFQAAVRFKKAGFDGVMIHGTHGFTPQQFMSPYTNHRTDKYGQDRMLFVDELIGGIKDAVGKDYPVIMRMSGDEFLSDLGQQGFTVEDMAWMAPRVEKAGADAIDISAGTVDTPWWLIQTTYQERGCILYLPEAVKKVVNVPVLGVGRVNHPDVVRKAVEGGMCDIVNIGRGMLADPEFPNKMKEGREDEIRRCIACNECLNSHRFHHVQCSVNADVGKEDEYQIYRNAPEKTKKVMIIGGGPAGMECARVAKLRGNDVYLYEKEAVLGGQLNQADKPPGKYEITNVTDYLSVQMDKLGVNVVLNTEVTPELVDELAPDTLVLATGARGMIPKIAGIDKSLVVMAGDVLMGEASVGDRIVIIGGELVACETAHALVDQGKQVTVCRRGDDMALKMEPVSRAKLLMTLAQKQVRMLPKINYKEITDAGVVIIHPDGKEELLEVDNVVLAAGAVSCNELLEKIELKTYDPPYTIGDAATPGRIYEAIRDGARVGRRL